MAKVRSPNYPAIGLGDAIKSLRLVWDKEKRTPVNLDVLTKAMGYSSPSGPARTKVAALRKYGLLEQHGSNYNVSQLGIEILYGQPDTQPKAMATAAMRPELFRELYSAFPDASDGALRSHLITKLKFSDAGAQQFIKAYRETITIANPPKADYIPQNGEESEEAMEQTLEQPTSQRRGTPVGTRGQSRSFSWPVSKEVTAEVTFTGGNVNPAHIDRLAKYLELAKLALEEEES